MKVFTELFVNHSRLEIPEKKEQYLIHHYISSTYQMLSKAFGEWMNIPQSSQWLDNQINVLNT